MHTSSHVVISDLLVCSFVGLNKILFLVLVVVVISPGLLSNRNVTVQAQEDDGILWWTRSSNTEPPTVKPDLVTKVTPSVKDRTTTYPTRVRPTYRWPPKLYTQHPLSPNSTGPPYVPPTSSPLNHKIASALIGVPLAVVFLAILVVTVLRMRQCYKGNQPTANGDANDADVENALNYSYASYARSYATSNARNAPPTYTDTCVQDLVIDEETTLNQQPPSSGLLINPPQVGLPNNHNKPSDDGLPSYNDVISGRTSRPI